MSNLVELVLRDHLHARNVLSGARRATRAPGQRDPDLGPLVRLLLSQEAAESLVFLPAVRRFVPASEPRTRELCDRAPLEELVGAAQACQTRSSLLGALDELASFRLAHDRDVEVHLLPTLRSSSSSLVLHRLGERYVAIRTATPRHSIIGGRGTLDFEHTPPRELTTAVHRASHLALARSGWFPGAMPRSSLLPRQDVDAFSRQDVDAASPCRAASVLRHQPGLRAAHSQRTT